MTISIAKITIKDIEFIKNLEKEHNLSSWSKKDYLEEIYRKDSIGLIVSRKQIKCGFLIARLIENERETEAEIYNIAIKKSHQNRHIGTILLNELIKIGKKNKLGKIFLEVRKSNNIAINFYRKNNFLEIGIRFNFYTNPTEDAILMYRSVEM